MPKDRSTHRTRSAQLQSGSLNAANQPLPPAGPHGIVPPPPPPNRIKLASLLLKLLPGFLPLIVYVLAESQWGETVGLLVAIGFGVLEFGYILIKERRPDWLSALDTVLLVAMGGVSLAFNDPIFLRIKPALIEALLAVLLGMSAFGTRNLVMGRMLREMQAAGLMNPAAEARMASLLAVMFWVLLVHVVLVVVAAVWLSEAIWIFVSGGLLFVMFGVVMAGMLVRLVLQRRRRL